MTKSTSCGIDARRVTLSGLLHLSKHELSLFPGDYSSPSLSGSLCGCWKRSAGSIPQGLTFILLTTEGSARRDVWGGGGGGQAGGVGAGERADGDWSASSLCSPRRALCAGWSRGPDDGRGLLRVLWGHKGVAVCSRICKWGEVGRDLAWSWALSLSLCLWKAWKKKN